MGSQLTVRTTTGQLERSQSLLYSVAQEISQPTLFSAMKSKIALAAVGALLLLQLPTKSEAVKKPYVETYWESWIPADYPDDFGAFLKDVPVGPPGSCTGANVVNIAFGDYSGGILGQESDESVVREGIAAIHAKGGLVKIALGGALFSMGQHVTSPQDALHFAEQMQAAALEYGLDGMDLDVEDSGAGEDVQVAVIKETRRLLPSFQITYTIAATVPAIEPWSSVIARTVDDLDAINIMAYDYYWPGYTFDLDLNTLKSLGVPTDKIVYGIMPGHSDAPNEYTSIEDAVSVADYVLANDLAGAMTWDVNRDCRKRMYYEEGEDNLFQTGQADGLFIDTLSGRLNNCS